MDLEGKTAIVTGAGSGVGRELAREFARHGARVVCCGRRASRLQDTLSAIEAQGGTGLALPVDVTDWAQVQHLVQATLAQYGQIDLLFNNAGSFQFVGPVWEADPAAWWQDVTVNLYGSMLCCRAVLPHMVERDSGILINMDGGGGSGGPNLGGSAYGCSKAALVRLSEGLARELEKVGSSVWVFCMNPGFVHTEMTEALIATPEKRAWQGHVVELMGSRDEMPPDACAKATMQLLRIAGPELSGRVFYVDTDWAEVERTRAEIRRQGWYVLRRTAPASRD
jgi:NAD(P)-dependent dehydrogenase (short-subunit alcohol dehydrogenase family)